MENNKSTKYKNVAIELLKEYLGSEIDVIAEYGDFKESALELKEKALGYLNRLDEGEDAFNKLAKDLWISDYYTEESAEADFMALCADESSSENPNKRFDGMTNGEVIQALFPYIKVETYEHTTSVKWLDCDKGAVDPYSYFWSKWWNAPYKVESEE